MSLRETKGMWITITCRMFPFPVTATFLRKTTSVLSVEPKSFPSSVASAVRQLNKKKKERVFSLKKKQMSCRDCKFLFEDNDEIWFVTFPTSRSFYGSAYAVCEDCVRNTDYFVLEQRTTESAYAQYTFCISHDGIEERFLSFAEFKERCADIEDSHATVYSFFRNGSDTSPIETATEYAVICEAFKNQLDVECKPTEEWRKRELRHLNYKISHNKGDKRARYKRRKTELEAMKFL